MASLRSYFWKWLSILEKGIEIGTAKGHRNLDFQYSDAKSCCIIISYIIFRLISGPRPNSRNSRLDPPQHFFHEFATDSWHIYQIQYEVIIIEEILCQKLRKIVDPLEKHNRKSKLPNTKYICTYIKYNCHKNPFRIL